ncbi:MAG: hypothetical protein J0G37_16535 [Afipia sp.]|nr:hypothetical protein [Afipia sp.]
MITLPSSASMRCRTHHHHGGGDCALDLSEPRPIAFMGSNHIGPVAQAHPLTRSERDTFVVFISQTGKERVRIGTALKYLVSGLLEK